MDGHIRGSVFFGAPQAWSAIRPRLEPLTLKRNPNAASSKSSGTSLVYDVRLGGASGRVVGRIYRVPISPQDRPWFWALSAAASPNARSFQRRARAPNATGLVDLTEMTKSGSKYGAHCRW